MDNININICKKCFKSKITEELYSSYLECIRTLINPMELNGNIQIQLKNNEKPKNFNLDQAIEFYNKNYYNENLDKKQVIKEIKKKVCICCHDDIKGERYVFPCDCNLCSKDHVNSYLSNIDLSRDLICSCSTVYTREMIFDLGILTDNLNLRVKNIFIEYFNKILKHICCICGKTTKGQRYKCSILISSKEMNQNQKKIDNFLRHLVHYFCEQCLINNNDGINCKICKMTHYFNNKKTYNK